jgi:carbon-monoxide dehydrogenase medium subunit
MFPAEFDYYRAGSLSDVHRLLDEHPGAKLLAGGHSLIPLLKLRLTTPPVIIDVGRVSELKGIAAAGADIRIGALSTHAELAASPLLQKSCSALAEAAGLVGDPQVRNRGTIGGNVAHADPASDLPTVLTALGARLVASGPKGERTIEVDRFFRGVMTTALGDEEVLTSILVPAHAAGQRSAYAKFAHPASRYSVIGAAAVIAMKGGKCSSARVAVGGLVSRPKRATSVEEALVGKELSASVIADAAARVAGDLGTDLIGDIYASAGYRKAMAPVYVKRAVTAAAGAE